MSDAALVEDADAHATAATGDPTPDERPPGGRRADALIAAAIILGSLALWSSAAVAELFWYDLHGARIVILVLASAPVGAAMLTIMARRLRPADGLSPGFLVLTAICGGFGALVVPSLVEPAWGRYTEWTLELPFLHSAIAGPLEEITKLVAVLVVGRWVAVRTARTGLFVGGAVGIGYGVLEDVDSALRATSVPAHGPVGHFGVMLLDVVIRQSIAPFGHPIWTALAAAALFAAWGSGRVRFTWTVVLVLVGVVAVHTAWDVGTDLVWLLWSVPPVSPVIVQYVPIGLMAAVGTVWWSVVVRRSGRTPAVPQPVDPR